MFPLQRFTKFFSFFNPPPEDSPTSALLSHLPLSIDYPVSSLGPRKSPLFVSPIFSQAQKKRKKQSHVSITK